MTAQAGGSSQRGAGSQCPPRCSRWWQRCLCTTLPSRCGKRGRRRWTQRHRHVSGGRQSRGGRDPEPGLKTTFCQCGWRVLGSRADCRKIRRLESTAIRRRPSAKSCRGVESIRVRGNPGLMADDDCLGCAPGSHDNPALSGVKSDSEKLDQTIRKAISANEAVEYITECWERNSPPEVWKSGSLAAEIWPGDASAALRPSR